MNDFTAYTNAGNREINEDYLSFYTEDDKYCFVIADGLGGEGQGDKASLFVCNNTVMLAEKAEKLDTEFVKHCFATVQKNLLRAKAKLGFSSEMSSTLSILVFDKNLASWGHIGDSRIYSFDGNGPLSVTTDHSLAQLMISNGLSELHDPRQHPDRSTLLAAMGIESLSDSYDIDGDSYPVEPGCAFLMCTDGFWQWLHADEMYSIIATQPDSESALAKMVELAEKRSVGQDCDNISAILIEVR